MAPPTIHIIPTIPIIPTAATYTTTVGALESVWELVGAGATGVGGILGMDMAAVIPAMGMDMGMRTTATDITETVTETDTTGTGTLRMMYGARAVVQGVLPKGVILPVEGVQELKSLPVNQTDPRRP